MRSTNKLAESLRPSTSEACLRWYTLLEGAPPVEDYLRLRLQAGLSPKTSAQGSRAVQGPWYSVVVRNEPHDAAVAMGRIIGDGGWYFHIIDMAVHPDHQGKGLGDALMARLMCRILDVTEKGPYT